LTRPTIGLDSSQGGHMAAAIQEAEAYGFLKDHYLA